MDLPAPLVDAEWLRGALALGSSDLVVFDVRWVPGGSASAAFEAGHIPGAVLLDADADLAGEPFVSGPGRHPLPSYRAFAATMSSHGVGDGVNVVAYDDAGGSYAARLWWMLDAMGHREVSVLDGGLAAWGSADPGATLEVGAGRSDRLPSDFKARPWPRELIADAEDVAAGLRGHAALVLDARATERYRGEVEPIDPVAGHIPGAVSAPWAGNLGPDGLFLDAGRLRERYLSLGVVAHDPGGGAGESSDASGDVIAHCGSGLTACHDILAIRVAGLGFARLYEGSWSDWVSDSASDSASGLASHRRREVATGADPGTLSQV